VTDAGHGRLDGNRGIHRRDAGRRTTPRTEGAIVTRPTDGETTPDPDVAEDFAEDIGVDPTQEEIDTYRRLEGEDATEPPPAIDGPVAG